MKVIWLSVSNSATFKWSSYGNYHQIIIQIANDTSEHDFGHFKQPFSLTRHHLESTDELTYNRIIDTLCSANVMWIWSNDFRYSFVSISTRTKAVSYKMKSNGTESSKNLGYCRSQSEPLKWRYLDKFGTYQPPKKGSIWST